MPISKASGQSVAPAAKGDLVVGSATNDAAVLGVGTDGQYLTAASTTATGLQWSTLSAGAYTSLASGTLSSTAVNITSISGSYRDLVLVIVNPYVNTATNLGVRINNDSSASAYNGNYLVLNGSVFSGPFLYNYWRLSDDTLPTSAPTTDIYRLTIPEYAVANTYKTATYQAYRASNGIWGAYQNKSVTGAITQLNIIASNGTSTFSGGTYTLYGVK